MSYYLLTVLYALLGIYCIVAAALLFFLRSGYEYDALALLASGMGFYGLAMARITVWRA